MNDNDTTTIDSDGRSFASENLPVLAGIEARIATQRGSRDRRPSKKAVMVASNSQSDLMSKESTARLKSCFVLKGPQPPDKTPEGRNMDSTCHHK